MMPGASRLTLMIAIRALEIGQGHLLVEAHDNSPPVQLRTPKRHPCNKATLVLELQEHIAKIEDECTGMEV